MACFHIVVIVVGFGFYDMMRGLALLVMGRSTKIRNFVIFVRQVSNEPCHVGIGRVETGINRKLLVVVIPYRTMSDTLSLDMGCIDRNMYFIEVISI